MGRGKACLAAAERIVRRAGGKARRTSELLMEQKQISSTAPELRAWGAARDSTR